MSTYFEIEHEMASPAGDLEVPIEWRAPFYEDGRPSFVGCRIGTLSFTEAMLVDMLGETEWQRNKDFATAWWRGHGETIERE